MPEQKDKLQDNFVMYAPVLSKFEITKNAMKCNKDKAVASSSFILSPTHSKINNKPKSM